MATPKYLKITNYKRRTLQRLEKKKEQSRIWPIKVKDLLEIKKCPLCGSSSLSTIAEVYLRSSLKFFSTATCQRCLFTFRSISPSLSWFKKCWQKLRNDKLEVFNPTLEKDRRQRYQEYYNLIRSYKEGGRLLDIGAAYGTGANVFKERGFTVETIEPEINRVNYLRKVLGIPVVADVVEKLAPKKAPYDVIIFAHCLEHLDHPDLAMSKIPHILKSDGLLYLEIPMMWNYVEWSDAFYMAHKSNFSLYNLEKFVRKNGLEIIKKIHYERTDLGLILRLGRQIQTFPQRTKEKTVNDVRNLYRKNWPLTVKPPLESIIRFSVPNIEQFFQIIRLEHKKMIPPKNNSDFFTFQNSDRR